MSEAKHPNSHSEEMDLAFSLGLMSMADVQRAWNESSGENITRTRVWQICKKAERILRKELQDLEYLLFD